MTTSQQRGHFLVTMICPCCGTKVCDDFSDRVLHQTVVVVHQRVCIGGVLLNTSNQILEAQYPLSGTELLIWKSIDLGISIILCRSTLIKYVHIPLCVCVCVNHNTGFHNTSSNILLVIPSHLFPCPYISPAPYPLRFSPSSAPAPGFLDLTVTSS